MVHLPRLLCKNEQRRSCLDGTINGTEIQNGTELAEEFVPASELADHGYPMSSPEEIELTGDHDFVTVASNDMSHAETPDHQLVNSFRWHVVNK